MNALLQKLSQALAGAEIGPQAVSEALYGPYVLGVELASMLLLAALIGARHVAARAGDEQEAAESMERARAKAEGRTAQPGQGLGAEPDVIAQPDLSAGPDVVTGEGDA